MNLAERAVKVEAVRFNLLSKSTTLARLYARLGCTPDGLSVEEHIDVIMEDNLQSMDEAVWDGAMTWFQAADLAMDAMDTILDGDSNG